MWRGGVLWDGRYEFAKGERVGVVGKNGAGKSTVSQLKVKSESIPKSTLGQQMILSQN